MNPIRVLGLDLAGARNSKTALAVLEFYPKEKKVFLLDLYDRIALSENETGDEALLKTLDEILESTPTRKAKLGVNVPLELPPCIGCVQKTCPLPSNCNIPSVKWMREAIHHFSKTDHDSGVSIKDFTPYTQRPFEIWLRYFLNPKIPKEFRSEIDETLGGTRAPLTARMQFLKRHLKHLDLCEVLPKLSAVLLAMKLGLPKKIIQQYRSPEDGMAARTEMLEAFVEEFGIFIYERDLKKMALSLNAFDAFICAYTALLSDQGETQKFPKSFPFRSGWVQYPKIS